MQNGERIEGKLDQVLEKLGIIEVTLATQHQTLVDHTRRSTLLEEQIKPIQTHVDKVTGGFKFLGLLGLIAGLVESWHVIFH